MLAILWSIAFATGAAAQAVPPAALCGGADMVRGNVTLTLRILNAPTDLHSPYTHVRVRNEDGSYSLSVGYRPGEKGLGKPQIVHVDALIGFVSDAEARPLRIEWREQGSAWRSPVAWSTPERAFPNEEARFRANYRMAQGEPFPHDSDVLDALARGQGYDFRNVDQNGAIVGSGSVGYPPQSVMNEIYAAAEAQALARLEPCRDGPVLTVPPAPPSGTPGERLTSEIT